jgi:release factor glutamine methyltransferase
VTVLEVIHRSSEFLARKGVDSPRLQIELLLAHVLQMPRMKLYLNFEHPLTEPELETLRGLVKRRGEREPLQHIVGTTSFCGFEIAVSRDVLIPRPETELLAERAVQFLATFDSQPMTVLDFGTGSGCLAIALAKKCLSAEVHALDVSEAALRMARQNAARHETGERVQFHAGDGFTSLPQGIVFDLIVSNPPYIPNAEIPSLQPEVRDFDPVLALDGGVDGLDFYRRLATDCSTFLKPGGRLMVEFGDGQAAAVADLLTPHGWSVDAVEKDYSGRERILIARRAD